MFLSNCRNIPGIVPVMLSYRLNGIIIKAFKIPYNFHVHDHTWHKVHKNPKRWKYKRWETGLNPFSLKIGIVRIQFLNNDPKRRRLHVAIVELKTPVVKQESHISFSNN